MGLSVVTPASEYPVTLADAKAHLRIDSVDEDSIISSLIIAATQVAEAHMSRTAIDTEYDYTLDSFPSDGAMNLPASPALSVTSVKYIDTDGAEQTWSSALYTAKTDTAIGTVEPAYGESYPSTRSQTDAVTVRFKAGYADASSVPESIKSAIKLLVGNYFENREAVVIGTSSSVLPLGVDALLSQYRLITAH